MSKRDDIINPADQEAADFLIEVQAALKDEGTRLLVRWILEQCGMFEPSFTGNSQTFFNEGRRSVGLEIVSLLNKIDPYEFVRLMKEGADDAVRKAFLAEQGATDGQR